MKNLASIAALTLTSLACVAARPPQVDPGHGIGTMPLGQARAAARVHMPKLTGHYQLPGGLSADWWLSADGTTRAFYREGRIVQISVDSLVEPLPGGLTMMSPLSKVLAANPHLRKLEFFSRGSGGGIVDYYDDRARGVAYEFIRPMHPKAGASPSPRFCAVLVHRPGVAVIPDRGESP